jgi:hypothetical protein
VEVEDVEVKMTERKAGIETGEGSMEASEAKSDGEET